MKKKYLLLLILTFFTGNFVHAQFDKPQGQFGLGVSVPYDDLKGTYYTNQLLGSFYVQTINPDFMTNNYGAKTGLNFFGKGKINFDKYSTVRGILSLNLNTFNTFESSKNGNIGVEVININNTLDTVITSISNNYSFTNFGIGVGLEIAPTSFTNLVTPYFGGYWSFNFMGGELGRTENNFDTVTLSFNDFRMGLTLDAGVETKISKTIGLSFGVKYDLGNLFLKNTNSGISDAIEYGKSNASLNDEEGRFYSTIYGPVLSSVRREVQSSQKEVNWGTIYIAVNFGFYDPGPPKTPTSGDDDDNNDDNDNNDTK